MNNAAPASKSREKCRLTARPARAAAFTLAELLIVVAIIAVLAGLIISTTVKAGQTKAEKIARVQLQVLETIINHYHHREGFYPPDNRSTPVDSARTPLFYELVGAGRNNDDFIARRQGLSISKAQLQAAFGVEAIVNSSSDVTEVKNYLSNFSTNFSAGAGRNMTALPVHANGALGLVMPLKGPRSAPVPDGYVPVHYVSSGATNNPDAYDLWVVIDVNGKTKTIGNWKER